jgi:5-methylcytosine-specific restriction endonuclease McrA
LIQETRTANEQSVARKMRSVALRAGKVWTLDVDVAAELVKQNCYYCGAEPKVTGQDNKYVKRNGIDRLDSSKGYEEGNVVTCCKRCNVAKNDQTSAEYEKQIENNYKQLILRKKGNNINGKSQLSSTAWRP